MASSLVPGEEMVLPKSGTSGSSFHEPKLETMKVKIIRVDRYARYATAKKIE